MADTWPKYYSNQIRMNENSPKANVGVICGWTKRDLVWEEFLDDEAQERVAVVGQLYSREGINYIIRNIFLNPNVTQLVVTGNDLSRSIFTIDKWLQGQDFEGLIQKEIPKERIAEFRKWFSKHTVVERNIRAVSDAIKNLPKVDGPWRAKEEDFPDPERREASDYPSEEMMFRLEEKKIAKVWLKALDRVIKFGREKQSQYSEMQRELIGLATVISDEDPDAPYTPDYFYMTENDLRAYYPQLMSDTPIAGTEYTYGSRLRAHFGVNQIETMIEKLKSENYTRRAVACAWDVKVDDNNADAPCLDLIQALVQRDKLYMTFYVRSNDMYRAYPQNAFAFRKVQKEIAEAVGIEMGKLCIISNSAHIYERDYEAAAQVVAENKGKLECAQDPRGNFVINLEDNKLKVTHTTPDGLALQDFFGDTAEEIMHQIYPFMSEILHALDFGGQLVNAENALKLGIEFNQDHGLDFSDPSMLQQFDFGEKQKTSTKEGRQSKEKAGK